MSDLTGLTEGLNPAQREAVSCLDGALLVVAGPGSGKTRVLTHRIAALVATGRATVDEVLAVTFTNRAAGEMRERVVELVGPDARRMWVMTFHAACVRILRRDGERLGLRPTFSIVDAGDARALVARVMEALDPGAPVDRDRVREAHHRISLTKNADQGPEALALNTEHGWVAPIMEAYDRRLAELGGLDFDDLLLATARLLREHPDVRNAWRTRFRHVLVDEFQDTNAVQYRILRLLADEADSLCVVGDPDQAIYSWRGATPEVMTAFREDEPGCRVVVLNQNYRSTPAILAAVQSIIDVNPSPRRAHLTTDNPDGPPVRVIRAPSSREEARVVLHEIVGRRRPGDPPGQFAVLVRTNAQTRAVEEECTRLAVPYRLLGALRFYDRAEVKDALAYLRAALDPLDRLALARALGAPKRGVGPKAVEAIVSAPDPRAALAAIAARDPGAPFTATRPAAAALTEFADALTAVARDARISPADALRTALERSGLRAALAARPELAERVENLDELVRSAHDFAQAYAERAAAGDLDLPVSAAFVENVTLLSAADDEVGDVDVVILSAHASKGKEFDHVYVTGVEEGLFPHQRALGASGIQEERRLLFVAASRARRTLTFTHCTERWSYGVTRPALRSRFLSDLPEDVEEIDSARILPPRPTSPFRSGEPARPRPRPTRLYEPPAPPRPVPAPLGPRLRPEDLAVGDVVEHRAFGRGVVRALGAHDRTAVVAFARGEKTLNLDFAPLTRPDPSAA